jgi:Ca2+-binding EF-hand superfamily protein
MLPSLPSTAALLVLASSPQDAPPAPPRGQQIVSPDRLGDVPIDELSGEERTRALELLHGRLQVEYFLASDLDGNGWISYREGSVSLRVDKREFFLFDTDRDGRISRKEFEARYQGTVAAVGSFRPPTTPNRSLFPTPEGTPLAYDFNGTEALEEGELRAFLTDKGIQVPPNALFSLLDQNGSRALELAEFADIVATLTPLVPPGEATPPPAPAPAKPRTVLELFGKSEPREVEFGTTPLPDRIAGPVPHFRRLDFDNDGAIEESDLLELLRPAHVDVRAAAVLAALDRDGDGRLSQPELAAAVGVSGGKR